MHNERAMKDCIDACNQCGNECEKTLFSHCLEKGGRHLEPRHVRLMADCAEMCRTAANAMLRGSEMHGEICRVCAEICEACAESCDALEGKEMEDCAKTCRRCAESCHEMAGEQRPGGSAASTGEGTVMA